ncbi:MAG TPA: sulfotransferase [Gaiellaceae bacterium]|nr:sulfotransferase [Gaiellaceae bacterium]
MRTTKLYGVRRRVWRIRRSVPRVARPLSRVLPASRPPGDPIFVIGCPRSGTTLLLDALCASGELASVQSEGHILWDEFHHPRDHGWASDAVRPDEIAPGERAYLNLAIRLFARGGRFVDKTPANCLRVPYLEELFPDATFVFLRRRAAGNVSSLMEGWRARPRFVRYRLPEKLSGLGQLASDRWSFVLVPGWRDLIAAPLEEICARQYTACNDAVLDACASSRARWIDVAYESLVAAPGEELRRLYDELGLEYGASAASFARELGTRRSATALMRPDGEGARERNESALERLTPRLTETERRLGYAT